MNTNLVRVGSYNQQYNDLLNISLDSYSIYYDKNGLKIHMEKRHHEECIPYIERLPEILNFPDYVGKSPREENGIEFIKKFDDNVMVGIKLDTDGKYMYVSTMYCIQDAKIESRVNSNRLKKLR